MQYQLYIISAYSIVFIFLLVTWYLPLRQYRKKHEGMTKKSNESHS